MYDIMEAMIALFPVHHMKSCPRPPASSGKSKLLILIKKKRKNSIAYWELFSVIILLHVFVHFLFKKYITIFIGLT